MEVRNRRPFGSVVLLLVLLLVLIQQQEANGQAMKPAPVIYTLSGPIQGYIDPVTGIHNYLGIPYSIPPVGEYRFNVTRFPEIWMDVKQTTSFGPNCIQNNPLLPGVQNEDCLYMNILLPPGTNQSSQWPVMVWIHGGGWYTGSGSQYDGSALVLGGNVIFVSFNYRLNALGFMTFPGIQEQHAYGIADQHLALLWIVSNLPFFGGDLTRITVFGESAGGASAALPTNGVEFHYDVQIAGLIFQSPAMYPFNSLAQNTQNSLNWAASLGCKDVNTVVACLNQLPAETIGSQLYTIGSFDLYSSFMLPSIGTVEIYSGTELGGRYLYPYSGYSGGLPIMIGTNEVEGNFLVAYDSLIQGQGPSFTLTESEYSDLVNGFFGPLNSTNYIIGMYQEVASQEGYWAAWSAIIGDYFITCPARLMLKNSDWATSSTYRYLLKRTATLSPFAFLNATHGDDLFFLFPPFINTTLTPEEQVLSQQMITYWTNFARCGDPNTAFCSAISPALPPSNHIKVPKWPVFVPSSPEVPNSQTVQVLNAPTISQTNDWNFQHCLPFLQFYSNCC